MLKQLCQDNPEDEKVRTLLQRLGASGFDISPIAKGTTPAWTQLNNLDNVPGGSQSDSHTDGNGVMDGQAITGHLRLDPLPLLYTLQANGMGQADTDPSITDIPRPYIADTNSSLTDFSM